MIVLINLNNYLGGGETLFVRMAEHLYQVNIPHKLICLKNSYIHNDLRKRGVDQNIILVENGLEDYYSITKKKRDYLINFIINETAETGFINYVTFCMRDLYTISQVSKRVEKSKTTHLVLHYQDNLYVCQSLFDKALKFLLKKEIHSRRKQIRLNNSILSRLSENDAIIPMSDLMVNFWNNEFSIGLKKENVVALPTYDFQESTPQMPVNDHKIIWIGRLVDFKIPALCVILNFINNNDKYLLTIVGSGNKAAIDKHIRRNKIDTSRIKFIGQVEYDELGEIIKEHSIGYAVGTSLIEICRYGLPCIMGLSTPRHKLFKKNICGGLYADCVKGNVGDNLFAGEDEDSQMIIDDAINYLEKDYEKSAKRCFEYVKEDYSFSKNIDKYLSIIRNSSQTNFNDIDIPKPSFIRRFLFKFN